MVSEHEVYLAAVSEADQVRREVAAETAQMRRETDDYIDAKLATFEITLQKTLQTVDRGRDRLRAQMYEELAPEASDRDFGADPADDFYDDQR